MVVPIYIIEESGTYLFTVGGVSRAKTSQRASILIIVIQGIVDVFGQALAKLLGTDLCWGLE